MTQGHELNQVQELSYMVRTPKDDSIEPSSSQDWIFVLWGNMDNVRSTTLCAKSAQNVVLRGDLDEIRKDHSVCPNHTKTMKKLQKLASEPELIELAEEASILIDQIDPTVLVDLQNR